MIFGAQVLGNGYNSGNNAGLWMWNDGVIRNILQIGQLFDVNPDPAIDDFRRINSIGFATTSFGKLGYTTGLTDDGSFVVRLGFGFNTSSSGLYLVRIVPEPMTATLFVLGLCGSLAAPTRFEWKKGNPGFFKR